MGCDIWMHTELRVDGKWVARGRVDRREGYVEPDPKPCDHRCYALFSILADVRNYHCDPPIVPISQPRGLPKDVSRPVLVSYGEGCAEGNHSASFLTLRELIEYDWCQTVNKGFQCDLVSYYRAQKTGKALPDSYCFMRFAGDQLDEQQAREKFDEIEKVYPYPQVGPTPEVREKLKPFCSFTVDGLAAIPVHELVGDWWEKSMPVLSSFCVDGRGVDDVRIVFWFGN